MTYLIRYSLFRVQQNDNEARQTDLVPNGKRMQPKEQLCGLQKVYF